MSCHSGSRIGTLYPPALGDILVSRSAKAALLHLIHQGETYGRSGANDLELSLKPIQRQPEKFCLAGLLVSKKKGKTLAYQANDQYINGLAVFTAACYYLRRQVDSPASTLTS